MGGGGGGSGPTVQQQQLETQQALTTANLNLEENQQRKAILNAMQGTRVFRGSALSRAVAGNTDGDTTPAQGPASKAQTSTAAVAPPAVSLLDTGRGTGSGATPSGGAGASGGQQQDATTALIASARAAQTNAAALAAAYGAR